MRTINRISRHVLADGVEQDLLRHRDSGLAAGQLAKLGLSRAVLTISSRPATSSCRPYRLRSFDAVLSCRMAALSLDWLNLGGTVLASGCQIDARGAYTRYLHYCCSVPVNPWSPSLARTPTTSPQDQVTAVLPRTGAQGPPQGASRASLTDYMVSTASLWCYP